MPQLLEISGIDNFGVIQNKVEYETIPGAGGSPLVPFMQFPMSGLAENKFDTKKLLTYGGIALALVVGYKLLIKK